MSLPPTPPHSNIQVVDPIVVPDQADNRCADASCSLCAPGPQAEQFPMPPGHQHRQVNPDAPNEDNARRPKKDGRTVRIKLNVQIRVPKEGNRHT